MSDKKILGVEGGGTKTAWVLCVDGAAVERGKLPSSNLRITPRDQLAKILGVLPREVDRVGVFLAGCGTEEDRRSLRLLARQIWPEANLLVGSDREAGLAACLQERDGIVVNAGTGSSVTGRRGEQIDRAGGWGHILGDTGGAYSLSIRALRSILREYDTTRGERNFATAILSTLALNGFDELVRWAQTAAKAEVASIAPLVFSAAEEGDPAARQILVEGAAALANFTVAVARRLGLENPEIRLMGSLFQLQPQYVAALKGNVLTNLPGAAVSLAGMSPADGAAWLAAQGKFEIRDLIDAAAPEIGATERSNPRSHRIDRLSSQQFVDIFVVEEKRVGAALARATPELAQAIDLVSFVVKNGGRIFYLGAGTSGRLGVLEAAELPPTFGVPPSLFQGLIAGGATALHRSVEGAEDNSRGGALALDERGVAAADLVIGLSASGRTPFVAGALARAREIGAETILLHCNPECPHIIAADLVVELDAGPELIAGSTRLKAGTATKVALNIISTGAMVQLGRTRGNRMIDLQATNEKLRERALRLVMEISGADRSTARHRLEKAHWQVREALKEC